ncbi:hypothetical protein [Streptomyces griseoaurantiacus]|uniref:hypothetical protein n=1 Tax=Streptomyces griseoaurantiacus TaxID=68213 RepID=UPI00367F3989
MTDTKKPPAEMTPVEIDTELSRLWNEKDQAEARHLDLQAALHHHVGDKGRRVRGARHRVFDLSWERALELAIIKARAPYTEYESVVAREVERTLTNWAMARRKLDDIVAEIKPYTDEYTRRGGWNRVYLANSYDGHAHNGTECSTCHHGEERTQFAWLVRYSGLTEAEIVADAGWRACTTCYPSAPVGDRESLPSKMFTPDKEEAAQARAERDQARAQRAADKSAKGITAPGGGPLQGRHGTLETERAAVLEATQELSERYTNRRVDQLVEADPGMAPFFYPKDKRDRWEAEARGRALPLIEAVAHKRGTTVEAVTAELEPKAYAKAKRDMGGKDWAQRFRQTATLQREEYDAYTAACKAEGRKPFEALALRWYKFQ